MRYINPRFTYFLTDVVGDQRQAPSQISKKFAGLVAQRTHWFHSDWYESMGCSNAHILDMLLLVLLLLCTLWRAIRTEEQQH